MIDTKGLLRIRGYVGELPAPRTYQEGAEILRRLGDAQFPKLDAASWPRTSRAEFAAHELRR